VCSDAAWGMYVCLLEVLLSGINVYDELITGAKASYRLWCVIFCVLETSGLRTASPSLARFAERRKKKYIAKLLF
jgi:hypothetical protein